MANKTIADLTAGSALADADLFEASQGGASVQITAAQIRDHIAAGLPMTGALGFDASADLASATTTDIGAQTTNIVRITGTTTITGLGTAAAGAFRFVRFAGVLTLTHNATSLILPGGANVTTAANDTAILVSEGSGNWRCWSYHRAATAP
jgi:hypothetical protein